MRVAVLGAGNGGVATAFDFAQHGHEVSLYAPPEFGTNIVAVAATGGIKASGDLQGFAPVDGDEVEGGGVACRPAHGASRFVRIAGSEIHRNHYRSLSAGLAKG